MEEQKNYRFYVNDDVQGEAKDYDEAVKIMEKHGLVRTNQFTDGGATEYWTESGEIDDYDAGVRIPAITRLARGGMFFND